MQPWPCPLLPRARPCCWRSPRLGIIRYSRAGDARRDNGSVPPPRSRGIELGGRRARVPGWEWGIGVSPGLEGLIPALKGVIAAGNGVSGVIRGLDGVIRGLQWGYLGYPGSEGGIGVIPALEWGSGVIPALDGVISVLQWGYSGLSRFQGSAMGLSQLQGSGMRVHPLPQDRV